jgi:hypothetical protein
VRQSGFSGHFAGPGLSGDDGAGIGNTQASLTLTAVEVDHNRASDAGAGGNGTGLTGANDVTPGNGASGGNGPRRLAKRVPVGIANGLAATLGHPGLRGRPRKHERAGGQRHALPAPTAQFRRAIAHSRPDRHVAGRAGPNVTPMGLSPFMVRSHVSPDDESQPVHPVTGCPLSGVAVRVTVVPESYLDSQVPLLFMRLTPDGTRTLPSRSKT